MTTLAGTVVGQGEGKQERVRLLPLLPIGASTVAVPMDVCVLPPTIAEGENERDIAKGLRVTVPEPLVPSVAVIVVVCEVETTFGALIVKVPLVLL